jgi:hypothetical protein
VTTPTKADEDLVDELCEMHYVGGPYSESQAHDLSMSERAQKIATHRETSVREERRAWIEALFPGNMDTTLGQECAAKGPAFAAAVQAEGQTLEVREALDEQARRVFAALCQGCQLGHPARYSPSGGDYYHAREDDPTRIQFCLANDMRLVLDPDGRLASPEA